MVRESPNPTESVTGRASRGPARRAILLLVAIAVAVMLWGHFTGYILLGILGIILIVSLLVYWAASSVSSAKYEH